ncbi:MAG: aminopeptidase [Candidatus Cloacimonas sp. 4484_143]|nr:MAG: aminopeptidase [Candidatus Cloacimonas sp. 4484_143]
MDPRIEKHAEVLINYSLNLQKDETLMINADVSSLPLAKACYIAALNTGAHPRVRIGWGDLTESLLKIGSDEQIKFVHEIDFAAIKTYNAFLTLLGGENTRSLANVDPIRMKKMGQGRSELQQLYFERMASKEIRWCGTMHPTQANAQEANMSLSEFEDFVYGACKLDLEDPVQAWLKVEEEQERVCRFLDKKKTLHIISKDTDIRFKTADRKWVNCSGKVNFPDGEVFTGPIEDSVEGHIRFSFPAIYQNREVNDVRLTFEKGKVVKASAAKGEDFLLQILDTDPGARFVGEIAIGTNYGIKHLVRHMLFDEKMGGTVHLAVGRSIPESLGKNQSVVHWDMLCDMKTGGRIYADDELFYENGSFLI